ncbi:NAD(P)/FAD-dependent oxidoreductase [Paenibacillus sp. y28]|uniref:NAD(P)/FAD-dependent oxidoreductase n=1 Tax=Paenibacillus sp. y28 TaxID=3129110 RepID=UPI00301AD450
MNPSMNGRGEAASGRPQASPRMERDHAGRKPRIVILGAGCSGISTAVRLQKRLHLSEADVTLVNKHDYHYFNTQLHRTAAGAIRPEQTRVRVTDLLLEAKVHFCKGEVRAIKPRERKVVLDHGVLSYDYLVVGLGGEPETSGIPGMEEFALTIRSLNSVRMIRQHVEYMLAKSKREPQRASYLTFAVCSADATGVDFAEELADQLPQLCRRYDVEPSLTRIIHFDVVSSLQEAGQQGKPQAQADKSGVFHYKGIEFRQGTAVRACTPEGLVLADGERLDAGTVIWNGGVKGSLLLAAAGLDTIQGRVRVDAQLRSPQHPEIWVVGENAVLPGVQNPVARSTAELALLQGKHAADVLLAKLRGRKEPVWAYKASMLDSPGNAAARLSGARGLRQAAFKAAANLRGMLRIGGLGLVWRKAIFRRD